MKFVIEWVDDENSTYYIQDEFGNRTELSSWNYDESGRQAREDVEYFMQRLAKVFNMNIEFEEREYDD